VQAQFQQIVALIRISRGSSESIGLRSDQSTRSDPSIRHALTPSTDADCGLALLGPESENSYQSLYTLERDDTFRGGCVSRSVGAIDAPYDSSANACSGILYSLIFR
jgi:hypothetical protein